MIMATASLCSSFSTTAIFNITSTKSLCSASLPSSSLASKWSVLMPATKISFQCKSPIALPVPRAYSFFGGEQEKEEEEEEEEEEEWGPKDKMERTIPPGYRRSESDSEEIVETEEEIAAAYEAIYGPPMLSKDVDKPRWKKSERIKDGLQEEVVQVRRVTKVVAAGRHNRFRAVLVVGNKKGLVGVGVGKAIDLSTAVQKAGIDARRNMVTIPLTKYNSFPHRVEGHCGAAKVMLRPAAAGSGVNAGGAVRTILEVAGVQNALAKQLGCDNPLNNCRAVIEGVSRMRTFREVADQRGMPMEELWK